MERSWGPRLRFISLLTGLLLLVCLAGLLFWSLWPLLLALPDLFYWTLLVAAAAIVTLFILIGRKRRARRTHGMKLEVSQRQNLGRVQELARQISWAEQGGLFQDKLRLELRQLARQLIAICRGVSAERARELLRAGGWAGQRELERFLNEERPRPRFPQFAHRIRALMQGRQVDARFERELNRAVQTLEAYSREEFFDYDDQRQHAGRED